MSTLHDVADAAGVSIATASRVLNGSTSKHPVSKATREAVEHAARRLNYTVSATARALKQRRSKLIGVIVGDILDPYFGTLARSIEIEAAQHGYVTVVANANRDAAQERSRFRALREHQASGIIFCGSEVMGVAGGGDLLDDVNVAVRDGAQIIALSHRSFECTAVMLDDRYAGRELTSYLISLGHQDIAFLPGIKELYSSVQRFQGYREALLRAGLKVRGGTAMGMSQDAGRDAMAMLLNSGPLPDAVVCSNDEIAVGSISALWSAGLRVPEDVNVACIGGTLVGQTFDVTSMTLPLNELGTLAARRIALPKTELPEVVRPELIIGATTAPRNEPEASATERGTTLIRPHDASKLHF